MKRRVILEKFIPVFEGYESDNNYVSVTFDDGPDRKYTPRILDILRNFEAKASFFLVGKKAEENPDIVMRILKEGHDIGNHTYSHPINPIFKYETMEREIRLAGKAIKTITGENPRLFRPTCWNTRSKKLAKLAKNLGYFPVSWSISSMDWLGTRKIIEHQVFNSNINHGDILLFHDGSEKSLIPKREATVDLLPKILLSLKNKNLMPLKLSRLLQMTNRH